MSKNATLTLFSEPIVISDLNFSRNCVRTNQERVKWPLFGYLFELLTFDRELLPFKT